MIINNRNCDIPRGKIKILHLIFHCDIFNEYCPLDDNNHPILSYGPHNWHALFVEKHRKVEVIS